MFGQVRLGQVRLGQIRLGQVRLGQVRLGQVRLGWLGQVRLGQIRLGQVRFGQVRLGEVSLGQFRLGQHQLNVPKPMLVGHNRPASRREKCSGFDQPSYSVETLAYQISQLNLLTDFDATREIWNFFFKVVYNLHTLIILDRYWNRFLNMNQAFIFFYIFAFLIKI